MKVLDEFGYTEKECTTTVCGKVGSDLWYGSNSTKANLEKARNYFSRGFSFQSFYTSRQFEPKWSTTSEGKKGWVMTEVTD
jgi:hypothetical protein